VCYCHALPRLDTATRVVILQHPRERDMPIGTARMASLCLPRAELRVGVRWTGELLAGAIGDPARPPILLYPGPGARDILRDPPRGPVTLIVVDGTWSQARTVVRDNPVLQALPRYAFATPELSHYRIRREPRAEYVSTIEALMHVLGALEGDPARFRSLLDPLRAMVDAQIACQAAAPRRGARQVHRPRAPRRVVPDAIVERFDDLVCVVGEANAWPYRGRWRHRDRDGHRSDRMADRMGDRTGDALGAATNRASRAGSDLAFAASAAADPAGPCTVTREPREPGAEPRRDPRDELVHWVAYRVATGESFERIVAPEHPLSPSTAFHIGLAGAAILGGAPRGELAEHYTGFARPTDLWCAWGHHGLDLAIAAGVAPAERLDLRAAAHRVANRKLGSLEAYAATLGPPPAPLAPGRAGRRVALLVQLVRAWRAQISEASAR
jgi:DTW domain-containing protein YfiP